MDADDVLSVDRLRSKFNIGDLPRKPPAAPPPPEPEPLPVDHTPHDGDAAVPLPRAGQSYVAHARPSNKAQMTLRFMCEDWTARGFSYLNLDSIDWLTPDDPTSGPVIVMRYAGMTPSEVTLHGRNLDMLYDLLGDHRIRWVRELGKAVEPKDAKLPVITHIIIKPFEG